MGVSWVRVVSMHLLVLSAFRHDVLVTVEPCPVSQCTFWCSVLSDSESGDRMTSDERVSMHLLVLSAFRHDREPLPYSGRVSQCTFWCSVLSDPVGGRGVQLGRGLNAPFGAQCFPTHLAWRVRARSTRLNAPFGAQCFPTMSWIGN